MIHQDTRQTDQMIQLTNLLMPLLDCDKIDYDWDYYLKNDTRKKDDPKFYEYSKIYLIGYKENALYFKFENGITRPLSYKELEQTYYLK